MYKQCVINVFTQIKSSDDKFGIASPLRILGADNYLAVDISISA